MSTPKNKQEIRIEDSGFLGIGIHEEQTEIGINGDWNTVKSKSGESYRRRTVTIANDTVVVSIPELEFVKSPIYQEMESLLYSWKGRGFSKEYEALTSTEDGLSILDLLGVWTPTGKQKQIDCFPVSEATFLSVTRSCVCPETRLHVRG